MDGKDRPPPAEDRPDVSRRSVSLVWKAGDKEEFDLGEIWEGENLAITVQLHNESEGDLHSVAVLPGCSCITAESGPSTLRRGKSASYKIVFSSAGYTGKLKKIIYVRGGDSANMEVAFLVSLRPPYQADPPLLRADLEKRIETRTVKIQCGDPSVYPAECVPSVEGIASRLVRETSEEGCVLELEFQTDSLPSGISSAHLEIKPESGGFSWKYPLLITNKTRPSETKVTPPRGFISRAPVGRVARRTFRISDPWIAANANPIRSARANDPNTVCDYEVHPETGEITLVVEHTPTSRGVRSFECEVELSNGKRVILPIRVHSVESPEGSSSSHAVNASEAGSSITLEYALSEVEKTLREFPPLRARYHPGTTAHIFYAFGADEPGASPTLRIRLPKADSFFEDKVVDEWSRKGLGPFLDRMYFPVEGHYMQYAFLYSVGGWDSATPLTDYPTTTSLTLDFFTDLGVSNLRLNPDQLRVVDLGMVLAFLANRLGPQAEWKNRYGETVSIRELARSVASLDLRNERCCDYTHELFGLAYVRYLLSRESGLPRSGEWSFLDAYLRRFIDIARGNQKPEGDFAIPLYCMADDCHFHILDENTRLRIEGHMADWMVYALDREQIKDEWYLRFIVGVSRIIRSHYPDVRSLKCYSVDFDGLLHGVHGLRIWRKRILTEGEGI